MSRTYFAMTVCSWPRCLDQYWTNLRSSVCSPAGAQTEHMVRPWKPHVHEGVIHCSAKLGNIYLAIAANGQLMEMFAISGMVICIFMVAFLAGICNCISYLITFLYLLFSLPFFIVFYYFFFFPVFLLVFSSLMGSKGVVRSCLLAIYGFSCVFSWLGGFPSAFLGFLGSGDKLFFFF